MGIDKYSLLKLKPTLLKILSKTEKSNQSLLQSNQSLLRKTLYGLLDNGAAVIKGGEPRVVVRVDGEQRKEFVVEKYERYKAGLMGRVWLKELIENENENENTKISSLISDREALGLKWELK